MPQQDLFFFLAEFIDNEESFQYLSTLTLSLQGELFSDTYTVDNDNNVSVNSKPDHPPPATRGDSHILVAPGVGFSLLYLARGVLNQNKNSVILKKSAIFALSLKQMSSSSFHMFIYARREQCDLIRGPTYLLIIRKDDIILQWGFSSFL